MLKNIKIVLVRTYHPGNIGSAARAMKTMGINQLSLVNPVDFPSGEALKMARGAADVVENATVVDSVYKAVQDCQVVIASTARLRGYDLPELSPEESARKLDVDVATGKVALVFGPERMGLSNDDLRFAKYRVTIPTSPDYPSLNIAAAVQTLCYEVFKYASRKHDSEGMLKNERSLPDIEELERFYTHMEETLVESGFIFKKHPGEVMKRFRHIFAKAQFISSTY